MKKIKKILIFISLIFVTIIIAACSTNANPGNNNGNGNNQVELPVKEEAIQKEKNEIIFISLDQGGQITSMKATNHMRNTDFQYYVEEGVFFANGHTNISSGKGPILIEGNKAYIPSLEVNKNFFYTLALDHNYYIDELPFKITTKYKLNGYTVGYESLKGKYGKIEIEIEVNANKNAEPYFQEYFGAQIQVPINLKYAHIESAEGAMANVITGTTSTLAYMIMPKASTTIKIVLDASSFSFEGIQAIYQAFDLGDLASSFINFDDLGLDRFEELSTGMKQVISEFSDVNNELGKLFSGIEAMGAIANNDEIDQLEELIDNIKAPTFRLGYRQAQNSIKLTLSNRAELVSHYTALGDNLESTISALAATYTALVNAIDTLAPKVEAVEDYPEKFLTLAQIITKLENIDDIIATINDLGEFNLETIISNKTEITNSFNQIGALNQDVQQLFQELIIDMLPLPYHLEALATDNDSLETIINNLILFLQKVIIFKDQLIEYCEEIAQGKADGIFSSTLDLFGIMDSFVKGVMEGDANNVSLISALDMIIEGFQGLDISEGLDVSQLSKLYIVDKKTNLRQIDELVAGFVKMNQALAVPQEGQDMSFYAGLQALASASDIIDLIPLNSTNDYEAISFLSKGNVPPISVQFIIKQQGF